MKRIAYLIPVLAFSLSACGGGGSHAVPASPVTQAVVQSGNLAVSIRIPAGAATSSVVRHAQFISASVTSIQLAFSTTGTPITQIFPITPGTGLCPTTASVTTCSFALTVPVTPPSVSGTLSIFGQDASGAVLSAANMPVTIDASGAQTVSAVLGGVPASLAVVISPASVPNNVVQPIPVMLEAFDKDNNLIVGNYATSTGDAATIALTSSDVAKEPISPASVTQSTTTISIVRASGTQSGAGATITATSGQLSAQATLVLTGPGSPTTLYYEMQPLTGNGTVIATTAVSPPVTIRTLHLSTRPTAGALAVTPNGTVYVVTGPNTIDVFNPGSVDATPVRTITEANFNTGLPIATIAPINSGADINGVFIGGSGLVTNTAELDTYAYNGTAPVAAAAFSNVTGGKLTSVTQSASSGLYYVWVNSQLQTFDHAPNTGDLTAALNYDIFEAATLTSQGVTGYPAVYDNNSTNCALGDDEYNGWLMVSCGNTQTTTFNLPANGSYSLTSGGQTFTVHGVLGFGGSGTPYPLDGSNPKSIAFDAQGFAYAFNGGSALEGYSQATILARTNGTGIGASVGTTYTVSGTILAATVGP